MRRKKIRHIDEVFQQFLRDIEDDFEVDIQEDEAVFPIEVVCKLAHIHYWTLRNFIKEGLIRPKKIGKKKMLFSQEDIKRVECVKYLMDEKGINIQGIKMFFEISREG